MRETRRWWEATAEYFQAEANVAVGIDWGPGIAADELGVLPDFEGDTVVELGCGGGQLGVGIAERGAERVVGVDLSRAQLGFAEGLIAERDVAMAVVEGDVADVPFRDGVADVVVSAYVFQWVPDLEAVFQEAARLLRSTGDFVFSVPHPFYGVFDPESKTIRRSYHEPVETRYSEEGVEADQVLFRRRLTDIHDALRGAGFVVDRLIEPGVDDPAAFESQWESDAELMAEVPRTLVVRAVSCGG